MRSVVIRLSVGRALLRRALFSFFLLFSLFSLGFVGQRRRCLVPLALPSVASLAPDLGHVSPVAADRLATLATNVGHVLPILTDRRAALPSDLGHVSPVTADGFAALATDPRHVPAILADGHTALSSRFAGLIGRKFVRATLDVSGFPALARDLALPLAIHRGESAPRFLRHDVLLIRPLRSRQPRCLYVWPCAGFHRVKCPKRLRPRARGSRPFHPARRLGRNGLVWARPSFTLRACRIFVASFGNAPGGRAERSMPRCRFRSWFLVTRGAMSFRTRRRRRVSSRNR